MSAPDYAEAQRRQHGRRDCRLRRSLLECARAGKPHSPTEFVSGRQMFDFGDMNGGDAFENEGHGLRLMRELVSHGYLEERVGTLRRGERFGLEHVHYRINAKGEDLLDQRIPADALVDDDRVDLGNL